MQDPHLLEHLGRAIRIGLGEHADQPASRPPPDLRSLGRGTPQSSPACQRELRIAEARPIWYDEGLERTLGVIESGCVIAALRNGTAGIPVDRSSLLPLVHDRWCFVLNGFVPDFRRSHMRALRADLPDDLYAALAGSSDSETLFLLALAQIREGASILEGLTDVASRIRARVGREEAQLNMVMSDSDSIVALRTGSAKETNSLYLAERPSFAGGGTVIASEAPTSGTVWSAVDGHSSVIIRADGSSEAKPIFLD